MSREEKKNSREQKKRLFGGKKKIPKCLNVSSCVLHICGCLWVVRCRPSRAGPSVCYCIFFTLCLCACMLVFAGFICWRCLACGGGGGGRGPLSFVMVNRDLCTGYLLSPPGRRDKGSAHWVQMYTVIAASVSGEGLVKPKQPGAPRLNQGEQQSLMSSTEYPGTVGQEVQLTSMMSITLVHSNINTCIYIFNINDITLHLFGTFCPPYNTN